MEHHPSHQYWHNNPTPTMEYICRCPKKANVNPTSTRTQRRHSQLTIRVFDAAKGISSIFRITVFHSLAFFWKPAPGIHSGTYLRAGTESTKNAPGTTAVEIEFTASEISM